MRIEASDIKAALGGNQILKGVGIEADTGDFVGIIGPNGSGKSTLLKCIYRTLKPDSGAVLLDGERLLSMSYRQSAKSIAVLAQHNY